MVHGQKFDQAIQRGNDLYKLKEYEAAIKAYDEVLTRDPFNVIAKFNRANAAYRLSRPDESAKAFDEIAANSQDPAQKAKAAYNKGVVLTNQKKLEESIEAYKEALRQDPNDKDARENLQKALLELKKKNPPKKDDNKKKLPQNKKQQQQPKMNEKDAEQKLKLMEQKEKELQQRLQKQKSKNATSGQKDW